ncbi:MAG TPA: GGDEF domain-containing protein [Candidatus Hydrogenedentes bacterium]|nr:GGDEF domain-containing protein [Candidatus Hydrogenedentota bacterium]
MWMNIAGVSAVIVALAIYLLWRKRRTPKGSYAKAFVPPPDTPLPEPAVTAKDVETLERSKVIIHGLMMNLSASIDSLANSAAQYDDALAVHKSSITKAMTLAAMKEVERLLLDEVDGMHQSTAKYREQLEFAQKTIQHQQEQMQRLSAEATLDFLTKIPNRRTLDARLQEEFSRTQRYQTPFSVIMMDIDHFKKINDTFGHIAGDRILRAVATVLGEQKRESDFLGRYGGEEFALILPETELPQAAAAAEKARRKIDETRFNFEGKTVPVNISGGVAQVRETDAEASAVVNRADQALYRAKQNGRNRIET